MTDFRREVLINTLRADYGITTVEELLEGIRTMAKVDISQFVLRPKERNILSENLTTETVGSIIQFGTEEYGDILIPNGVITKIGTLNYDEETGYIYDEEGDVVDEDTIAGFCEGDGKGDDEDE